MAASANTPGIASADPGAELKRGALTNTVALLASNFRGIFTFLVARLLGPAALGTFSVAWATTDLLTKIGMFGLDNTITTFIARAEAAEDRVRSRQLCEVGVAMAVLQCALLAGASIAVIQLCGDRLRLNPQMIAALSVLLCAMPGVALYRISTAVSRGMKVMRHDIYSRGLTETIGTTAALLFALALGSRTYAPEIAAITGTTASGVVALMLALSLFCLPRAGHATISYRSDARRLLAYSAPITAYDLLNAFIVRMDVIMLGCFIGRAPGVTLPVVGIYGAVVEVAGGLRKINQVFNPIFAPVVAGMTAEGVQQHAAAAFSRVAQWMLWALFPPLAVMVLGGSAILSIYGAAFREGSTWLAIVAIACATNAFVGLAETVIMVQRPRLNLFNSAITCVVALAANFYLIGHFGATGAAFGILLPYVLLGILRYRTLRSAFRWQNPWANIKQPVIAALAATLPAVACRVMINGVSGQLIAAAAFVIVYFVAWRYHRARPANNVLN